MKIVTLLLSVVLVAHFVVVEGVEGGSLCDVEGCECREAAVHCLCHHKQVLKVGLHHRVQDASQPPEDTRSLTIQNCHHVELYGGLLNHMEHLQNLSISQAHAVVLHPKLYDSRGASEAAGTIQSISLSNIHNLQVRRYSFKDLKVTGIFYLGEVVMDSVVSMAFHFKFVKEFSVFASVFERISMFGVKIDYCREFNILGMTHFNTLAAHAIKVKCDKFSLAYNWFGNLHDSSFDVEFGLCDIQGNTFNTLQGKPFLSLAPQFSLNNEISQMGLVFRENKFVSYPVLPFASLALPSYGNLPASSSYIDIEGNQFVCDCQSIGWFLAYGKLDHNSKSLSDVGKVTPRDEINFIREVFRTSGSCIECYREEDCRETRETIRQFADIAISLDSRGAATCHGVTVKNYDIEINNQIQDGTKTSDKNDMVKNEKLVGSSESGERLTANLMLINDGRACKSDIKIVLAWSIISLYGLLNL